jgi:hypothetical protein
METDDPATLDHVMARLAAGDLAYAVTLAQGWCRPIGLLVTTLLTERDRRIVVEYLQQQAAGDPSPSHTVGRMFELAPATVRQVCSRALRKVRAVLGGDPSPTQGSRVA